MVARAFEVWEGRARGIVWIDRGILTGNATKARAGRRRQH